MTVKLMNSGARSIESDSNSCDTPGKRFGLVKQKSAKFFMEKSANSIRKNSA